MSKTRAAWMVLAPHIRQLLVPDIFDPLRLRRQETGRSQALQKAFDRAQEQGNILLARQAVIAILDERHLHIV